MASLLKRIKIVTVAVPDVDEVAAIYRKWIGYKVVERGKVSADLAALWASPAMKGRPYVTMQPASGVDVFVRAVEIDRVGNYRPMTSWGWGAIEIICRDPRPLSRKLAQSDFIVVGRPRFLNGYPTICAMQVQGPGGEILYLTADTGPKSKSILPDPGAEVGRPFVMVVASGSSERAVKWYAKHFKMKKAAVKGATIDIIQNAQGLPPTHPFPMGFVPMSEAAHFVEFDGYPAGTGPRQRNHGQLPPGVAVAGFEITDLRATKLKFLSKPANLEGIGYDGRRVACTVGPGGELIELIELANK
ncbi:MAG: VOC family protein [Rhodobacteraceae bacterium]|nr:VOC family protein [Paracoccaceae bacterium]